MLDESMKTVQEMKDFQALKRYLFGLYGMGNVTIKKYEYDDRIGWNTYIVCHNGGAVGFTNMAVDINEPDSES